MSQKRIDRSLVETFPVQYAIYIYVAYIVHSALLCTIQYFFSSFFLQSCFILAVDFLCITFLLLL